MGILAQFYGRSPARLQNAFLSGRGIARALALELTGTMRYRRVFRFTDKMGAQQLGDWQCRMLAPLLKYTARRVSFYSQQPPLRPGAGGHPADMLADWPLLCKEDVRQLGSVLLAKSTYARFSAFTSGTTGAPMQIYRTPHSIAAEQALVERQLQWAGWKKGMRRVWLRGDAIVPLRTTTAPFWRHNRAQAMLMCSSFHLTEKNAPLYLKAIESFDPAIIQAYPSAIAFLARWMIESGRRYRGPALRGIVTSSERLTELWRRDCRRAFGVAIFDWFGQAERVAAIGTCEHGNYHLIEDGSYIELRPRGDGSSNVVGTGFHNYAMPLIRYNTGDSVVAADPSYACPCGRCFRVIDKVHGRESDSIMTSDGRQHIMLDFIFDDLTALKEAQIVQEAIDSIIINVALQPNHDVAEVRDILLARAHDRFGPDVAIGLNTVAAVPRTSAGKFPLIVSRLKQAPPAFRSGGTGLAASTDRDR